MVFQRISDLVWMGQGICKVNRAQWRLTCAKCEHILNNCSVLDSILGKHKKDNHDEFSEHMDDGVAYKDVDFETDVESETATSNAESAMPSSSTSTIDQKREYSTNCFRLSHATCRPHSVPSFYSLCSANRAKFHTSALKYQITAEDLAKVAELAKNKSARTKQSSTEDKHKGNMNLKQNLSSRSKEKRVPASRIGRVASFGGLAAGLMMGTLSEMAKKTLGGEENTSRAGTGMFTASAFMSDANLERIVNTLCRVRGAALKLGQMLSIQDETIVDPRLLEVFDRVRQSADFMPASQMKKVLVQEFGKDWQNKVAHFEEKPFAAASIGQVHRAILHDGREIAMKIQYPGVANSIDSDINNLVALLKLWNLFPEQFFIDKFIAVARKELSLECDYEREAEYSEKFRNLLSDDCRYRVPVVIPELSTKKVISTELISGVPLDQVAVMDQDTRNFVASAMLNLLMREIFEFRTMQTDPNWSNFFYDPEKRKINLLDFGASREYPEHFVDEYIEVVRAASLGDRKTVLEKSRILKFLTGYETKVMEDAHIDAVMILGEPFAADVDFDFSAQNTTRRIVRLMPTMMEHRLTAPPEESYSLHRKLSGGFLLAAKLKSKFQCKHIFDELYTAHHERKSILTKT